jgi:hypothetical protein
MPKIPASIAEARSKAPDRQLQLESVHLKAPR